MECAKAIVEILIADHCLNWGETYHLSELATPIDVLCARRVEEATGLLRAEIAALRVNQEGFK